MLRLWALESSIEDVPSWTKAQRLDLGQFQSLAGPDLRLTSAKCENIGQTWLQDSLHLFLVCSQPQLLLETFTTQLVETLHTLPSTQKREIPKLRC